MTYMIPVGFARGYIADHSIETFITPEGLTAKADACFSRLTFAERGDDRMVEELQAFPIVDGRVDMRAVKQWLGY